MLHRLPAVHQAATPADSKRHLLGASTIRHQLVAQHAELYTLANLQSIKQLWRPFMTVVVLIESADSCCASAANRMQLQQVCTTLVFSAASPLMHGCVALADSGIACQSDRARL
jgi:hypothetical protein